MVKTVIAVLLVSSVAFAQQATVYMHEGTEGAIALGCLKDRTDLHCFELGDFLKEMGLEAHAKEAPKTKAAPKKEAAPKAPKQNEL